MQRTATFLLQGGLDLVTPPVALQPGRAISAVNYEADAGGYRRFAGYERYDGRGGPSRIASPEGMEWAGAPMEWADAPMIWDAVEFEAVTSMIQAVPGAGPVRGVWVYRNQVYAFRDQPEGVGGMFRGTATGWARITGEWLLFFDQATAAFVEGETVTGADSDATGVVHRVQTVRGTYSGGDAEGAVVLKAVSGAFAFGEVIESSTGAAKARTFQRIDLAQGGQYEFANFNFYGAAATQRMYFVNGQQPAMEWDGETLVPLISGASESASDDAGLCLTRGGDRILARGGGAVILRTSPDRPIWVAEYANHLWLGFRGGTMLHSSIGVPTDWRALTGGGEIGFGAELTGLLSAASTALVVFGDTRIGYITGRDNETFTLNILTDAAGALPRSMQAATEPVFLDAGGVRGLSAADVFGDWSLGTVTRDIDPMLRELHRAGERPRGSIFYKPRGCYRLFFSEGRGISIYFGGERPASMPLLFPVDVHCACAGEISGEHRAFIGASNGFVYEMDRGDGFDGQPVEAYLRLAWNAVGAPTQQKRFHRAMIDVEAPEAVSIGLRRDIDYWRPSVGDLDVFPVDASGRPAIIASAGDVDWTRPDQGAICAYIEGVGRNMALSFVSGTAVEPAHTISAVTINFTPRKLSR